MLIEVYHGFGYGVKAAIQYKKGGVKPFAWRGKNAKEGDIINLASWMMNTAGQEVYPEKITWVKTGLPALFLFYLRK